MTVADRADQAIALVDLHRHAAPDGTVGAHARNLLDSFVPLVDALDERAGGTYVDAGSAEFATRFEERRALRRPDEALAAAFGEREGVVASDLAADSHASAANDAQVQVHVPERVGHGLRQVSVVVG